jgi:hypothetical protein
MRTTRIGAGVTVLWLAAAASGADVKTTVDFNPNDTASAEFKFKTVPSPAKDTAATKAKIAVVDGEIDGNSGGLKTLNDGKLPTEQDEPAANFFFDQGTPGGRLSLDLGSAKEIKQVNTYSWHPNTRGPQVYKLYASDGTAKDFNAAPKDGTDPVKVGWTLVATVDTRPKNGADGGGQYGVSTADKAGGAIGKYRYLLFEMSQTEKEDPFGNTFYSEIDIIPVKK